MCVCVCVCVFVSAIPAIIPIQRSEPVDKNTEDVQLLITNGESLELKEPRRRKIVTVCV